MLRKKRKVEIRSEEILKEMEEKSTMWIENLPLDAYDFLIVDEAHHFPSSFWKAIVERCQECHIKVLFLTATPYRTDGQLVVPLSNFEFNGKAEQETYYHVSLKNAQDLGYIRTVKKVPIQSELPASNPIEDTTSRKQGRPKKMPSDREDEAWKKTLEKIKTCLDQKDANNPLPDGRKHKALIMAPQIIDVRRIFEMAKEIFSVGMYYSKMKGAEIAKKKFESHEADSYRVLIIVDQLREGYDFPSISVVAICCNVQSPIKLYQFVGRGLRIDGEAKAECHVIWHSNMYPQIEGLLNDVLVDKLIPPAFISFEDELLDFEEAELEDRNEGEDKEDEDEE